MSNQGTPQTESTMRAESTPQTDPTPPTDSAPSQAPEVLPTSIQIAQKPPMPLQGLCDICNKVTKLVCEDCVEPISVHYGLRQQPAFYCSLECQTQGFEAHKVECAKIQARRILYRTGEILQLLFYAYRENMWDKVIAKIDRRDGKLYVRRGDHSDEAERKPAKQIIGFPYDWFSDQKEMHMTLAFHACEDALVYMADIVEYLLGDTVSNLAEVSYLPAESLNEIVHFGKATKTKEPYRRGAWKMTLKADGVSYALDLTGAQNGIFEPVTPWDQYRDTHIRPSDEHIRISPFCETGLRYQKAMNDGLPLGEGRVWEEAKLMSINLRMCHFQKAYTTALEEEYKTKVAEILKKPRPEFEVDMASFVEAHARRLEMILEFLKKERNGTLYDQIMLENASGEKSQPLPNAEP